MILVLKKLHSVCREENVYLKVCNDIQKEIFWEGIFKS